MYIRCICRSHCAELAYYIVFHCCTLYKLFTPHSVTLFNSVSFILLRCQIFILVNKDFENVKELLLSQRNALHAKVLTNVTRFVTKYLYRVGQKTGPFFKSV